ncbi:MAG: amidohydrolase family protein [Acidobacteria bacterium]|nr:amidohydrolase family protein [Acidobacteriota bacterium]
MANSMKLFLIALWAGMLSGQTYDLVISGGRVMDPESGLDAVRHIGIRAGKVAAISATPLKGNAELKAAGRVVAPGFIDLHSHGQTNQSNEYQAHDGVTTALELEAGVVTPAGFLKQREGRARINYGATVSHATSRTISMDKFATEAPRWRLLASPEPTKDWNQINNQGRNFPLARPEELSLLAATLERGLKEGALGIGLTYQYVPGASRDEIFRVFEMAARWKMPIFVHVRTRGLEPMQEMVANAAATGASVHIVHVNSSSLGALPLVLDLIDGARKRGVDVTTEAYPYTASSTFLESAIFDEGWQQSTGISYGDLQWVATGERLTKETFEKYRAQGGIVIAHSMKPEWIARAMASPAVMIGSDGMPYAPGAHPRSAGTFSRVLGRYVREQKVMSLMDGLAKMTIMPARRLEPVAPAMKNKGRIRVGADADITVFDPERILDTATFEKGLSFSTGIDHVLVNGVAVVQDGQTVKDALPGKAVTGNYGQR